MFLSIPDQLHPLVYGHDGFAGELGHVIMRRNNGRPCGCGRQNLPRHFARVAAM